MGVNIHGHLPFSRAHCQAKFVDDKLVRGVSGRHAIAFSGAWDAYGVSQCTLFTSRATSCSDWHGSSVRPAPRRMLTNIQLTSSILSRPLPFFVPASYGLFDAAGVAESSGTNVMVEVVSNSVAWSRRVAASSDARRTFISADEFNRESSRMILKDG